MSGSSGGGDNYVQPFWQTTAPDAPNIPGSSWGSGGAGAIDPLTMMPDVSFGGVNMMTGNPEAPADPSFWDQLRDPAAMAQLRSMQQGLGTTLKPLTDPNAAQAQMRAVPPIPPASIHPGQPSNGLDSYLQALQQRQQALRAQFLPRTAGLLGG